MRVHRTLSLTVHCEAFQNLGPPTPKRQRERPRPYQTIHRLSTLPYLWHAAAVAPAHAAAPAVPA